MGRGAREKMAERFADSVDIVMRVKGSAFRRTVGRHGVTLPQFFLLKVLSVRGEMTVTQVSREMMVATPTASRMIENLCARGLLERRKDENNRRVTWVRVTERGREALLRVREENRAELARLMEGEDEKDLEVMVDTMERIARRITSGPAEGEGCG